MAASPETNARGGPRPLVVLIEAVVLVLVGGVVGLVANALSPVGIPLSHPEGKFLWDTMPMADMERAIELYDAGAIFIDARPEHEFVEQHIAGALNVDAEIGMPQILERLGHLPKNVPLVTYCDSFECGLSAQLAEELKAYGFAEVHVFKPGWSAWLAEDLPTMHGAPPGMNGFPSDPAEPAQ